MPLDVIVGTQWGDEGKGRITDLLAQEADVVARYSGGDNAGHTVTVGDDIFKLHLIPSGIVHPHTVCLMGNGMVVNPDTMLTELDGLAAAGINVSPDRLKLSNAAHVITPAHIALDGAQEKQRGGGGLGTTKRGIGPAYTDKAARRGLRAGSMADPGHFASLVEEHIRLKNQSLERIYHAEPLDPKEGGRRYGELAEGLRPYLADVGSLVNQMLEAGKSVLAEGAQGTLLDIDHGTYPFVTSSSPTTAGALLGLAVGPMHLRRVVGVVKAFQSRVGTGPFPTELLDAIGDHLRGTGAQPWDEFGTTTGRPRRCGWLDGVLLRYSVRVNGLTELALTKLDILSGLNLVRICVAYQEGADRYTDLPDVPANLDPYTPEYQSLSGWEESLWTAREWADLPSQAQDYVKRIEELASLPVHFISVGPERDQVVRR